jgi:hypothetical protein
MPIPKARTKNAVKLSRECFITPFGTLENILAILTKISEKNRQDIRLGGEDGSTSISQFDAGRRREENLQTNSRLEPRNRSFIPAITGVQTLLVSPALCG